MTPSNVVLCSPVRSAIGTYGGTLKGMPAPELGAWVIRSALERAALGYAGIWVTTID
jgi:acetyl-CoA C-acetyltransferase